MDNDIGDGRATTRGCRHVRKFIDGTLALIFFDDDDDDSDSEEDEHPLQSSCDDTPYCSCRLVANQFLSPPSCRLTEQDDRWSSC